MTAVLALPLQSSVFWPVQSAWKPRCSETAERTGNVDMITLAMNMWTQGIDPELDFSNMNKLKEMYERVTKMKVGERQPYAGELVFTAFSGLPPGRHQPRAVSI